MDDQYDLDPDWDGWLEITVGVEDVDAAAAPLIDVSGWSTLHRGRASAQQKAAWNLDPAISVEEHVIHIPQTYGGFIRFVSFQGAGDLQQVRPNNAAPWDAGGIWLFNTRAHVIEDQSSALAGAGYPTRQGIKAFDFEFLSVKEVIHEGPSGMRISVLEQVSPPIDPPEPYPLMSRAFNATIICRDHAESRAFYVEKLGFKPWIETTWDSENQGLSLIAPTRVFEGMKTLHASNINPQGNNFGSIELLTYDGDFAKADHAARAAPPALGNLSLRFYTDNLDGWLAQISAQGVYPIAAPVQHDLKPFGTIRSAIVKSPEGVWLEFFERCRG